MAGIQPPRSPTLAPPRKSIELEDPGAHELESSNDEEDVFSEAPEGEAAPKYGFGVHDDVPSKRLQEPIQTGGTPVPVTVVEKVDPLSPSHGDVPGTAAYALRLADAVPDAILQAPLPGQAKPTISPGASTPTIVPIPRTVVTRVDSTPSHGEVPGTNAYNIRTEDAQPDSIEKKGDVPGWPTSSVNRSSYFDGLKLRSSTTGTSPIAADGGFGPMDYEDDEEDGNDDNEGGRELNGYTQALDLHAEHLEGSPEDNDESIGDEFDDFEEGAAADDFGDFDDGSQPLRNIEDLDSAASVQISHISLNPFPLINFSSLNSLDHIIEATIPQLTALFPAAYDSTILPSQVQEDTNSVFLTDRSISLWSQLVAPPPLQPPNWTRSRIRRLFLVSLGVPVDLDEILPASKQKKLILPFTSAISSHPNNLRKGSIARLKETGTNAWTTSIDSSSSTPITSVGNLKSGPKRRKGPVSPPDFDVVAVRQLCNVTVVTLENFSDSELQAHISSLEKLMQRGKEVLQYWVKRKEDAVGDKDVFEGVIENLVRHARRVRK
ncbi:hypothetical protein MMC34_008055 [Xylographa carneopallida]|nr:hypothetical protein [Xylographa carneopallida]